MQNKLFDKNYLKNLCQKNDLGSPREFGQHFLIDKDPIDKMISAGQVDDTDHIIELGPGFGSLTFALSERAKKVTAFEIEQKLRQYWGKNEKENIEIIWGDGLDQLKAWNIEGEYKFISNLPYQITSKVIRQVLERDNKPSRIIVMVQKEVADRICATKDKSVLTILVQLYGDPYRVCSLSPDSFYPRPAVDSTVIAIENISDPQLDENSLFQVVKAGFKHRRKQLKNNLASAFAVDKNRAGKLLESIIDNKQIRAQQLSVNDWRQLTLKLQQENLI
ncbi:MAG: 16S rRNA (adenine(1518)-N(6)/adenine(1519)-N(6))-dimethyltransferase RsmA [Candidatus Paceibacteria bacterium]